MYVIKVLMPFNVLIDTDVGVWKLIQDEYHNEVFFLPGMLDVLDVHKKYMMMTRDTRNPLLTILTEPSEELADDFYNQFMEKEYNNILEKSPTTDVCKILDTMRVTKSNIIRLTILCRNEEEKQCILDRDIVHDSIIVGEMEKISLSEYGVIFIKDVKDLDRFRRVEGKILYIANYGFNIYKDQESVNPILPFEVIEKYSGENEFYVYSVYHIDPKDVPR